VPPGLPAIADEVIEQAILQRKTLWPPMPASGQNEPLTSWLAATGDPQ
jgi:hypothetical protein